MLSVLLCVCVFSRKLYGFFSWTSARVSLASELLLVQFTVVLVCVCFFAWHYPSSELPHPARLGSRMWKLPTSCALFVHILSRLSMLVCVCVWTPLNEWLCCLVRSSQCVTETLRLEKPTTEKHTSAGVPFFFFFFFQQPLKVRISEMPHPVPN
jgi:hypothetical protein